MTNLPITMPAIRKLRDAPGLDWCPEIAIPEIGPREVLVAVAHAGICGTDRHIYEWDPWSRSRVKVGITTGHEFVGKVIQVGAAVTRATVGDRVSAEGHVGYGTDRLQVDPIITHVIEMEDYEKGFKMMQSGEAIKVIMKIPQ